MDGWMDVDREMRLLSLVLLLLLLKSILYTCSCVPPSPGGKKKADMSSASRGEVIELLDPTEREAINANPLKKMEREAEQRHKLEEERKRIHILAQQSDERRRDDYGANKSLRRVMRAQRKDAKAEEKRLHARGLGIKLVRESDGDKKMAKAMVAAVAKNGVADRKRRRDLKHADIFAGTGQYEGGRAHQTTRVRARRR